MKICFVADAENVHIHRWADFMHNQGHEVHVVTFQGDDVPGAEVYHIRAPLSNSKLRYITSIPKTKWLINQIQPDLLHGHYVASFGTMAAQSGYAPLILSAWGSDVFKFGLKSALHKKWMSSNFKRASAVTTTSHHMRDILVNEFGVEDEKIHTFSWGIGATFFERFSDEELKEFREKYNLPEGKTLNLSPRRLAPIYGGDIIIKGFSIIADSYPEAHLLLMNGADDKLFPKQMRHKVLEFGLENRVTFLPKLPDDRDVAKLFSLCPVFISIPESDQLSSSILEGMACGSIPILADLEPYFEIVEDGVNGFYIRQRDSACLASTLDMVLAELPSISVSMSARNREHCETHERWEDCAEKMHDLYLQVAGAKVDAR